MITFSSFLNWLSGVLGVDSSFLTTLAQVELLESSTNGSGNPPNVSSNAEFTTPPDVDFELPVNSLFGDGFKARIWPKSEFRVESGDLPVAIVLPGTADLNLTCTATDVGVDILAAAAQRAAYGRFTRAGGGSVRADNGPYVAYPLSAHT